MFLYLTRNGKYISLKTTLFSIKKRKGKKEKDEKEC